MQVSPLAGGASTGRRDSGNRQPVPAAARSAHFDGHDCGRDHHSRTEFDQEPAAGARPGDAPDFEGEAMVFRHEGACGRGQQEQIGAYGSSDGGPRGRLDSFAGAVAW